MDQKLGVISFDISESSCSKYYQNKMRVKNTVNKLKYLKQIVKNPKSLKIKKHLFFVNLNVPCSFLCGDSL